MIADPIGDPEPAPDPEATFACTFGVYNRTIWNDVRGLPWADLANLLTTHEVGEKEGTCIVPATFSGTKRAKADAVRIEVVFLDSDAGYTLAEIQAAVSAKGWTGVVSSTHSHLTTTTQVKRGNWDKFRVENEEEEGLPERYLTEVKGYLGRVAKDAKVASETDDFTIFEHQPCPKFRVALPLQRPWLAANYDNQKQANAAWKERIEALAAALRLSHDQACTDTSRLFYLPRRPADGPQPETTSLDGEPCDIFGLPRAEPRDRKQSKGNTKARGKSERRKRETIEYTNPNTGEIIDLTRWSGGHARTFQLAAALTAKRAHLFVPRSGEGAKRHIRCVNEEQHTQSGADAATFIVDASESTSKSGFVYHCRHAHCDGRDRLLFLRQMLEQEWLTVEDLTDTRFQAGPDQVRSLIKFVGGELPVIVDQAEAALIAADLGIYQRGAFVVRPGMVSIQVAKARTVEAERILELGDHALVEALTISSDWEKYDARSESWVRIDAPLKVAATYKQRVGRWRLPILTGLINAPTLRDDGSVLADEGYDPTTGLLLNTNGTPFPAIPDRPGRDEAVASMTVLTDLIKGFSFVQPADRSVALSAMLTACIRRSLPTAPLHAFTAPVMGSGKSKLVDIATVMASGREASVIAQGKTEEETEKRLGALLLAGDAVIAIDNCESPLGGDFLCQMLTQPVVRARILGRSEAPELPANAMVTATGNNLVLIGDMARRALLCQLDPQCERPELRVFDQDPVEVARSERGKYVIAVLTILRAFHVAGRPKHCDPLGSFRNWSVWVRDTLVWLGEADPVATLDTVRDHDPKLDALIAVLTQWWDVIGAARVSVQNLIEYATRTRVTSQSIYAKHEIQNPALREALLHVAGDAGVINGRRLGKWVAGNEGRIVSGFRIIRKPVLAGFQTWELEQMSEARADAA